MIGGSACLDSLVSNQLGPERGDLTSYLAHERLNRTLDVSQGRLGPCSLLCPAGSHSTAVRTEAVSPPSCDRLATYPTGTSLSTRRSACTGRPTTRWGIPLTFRLVHALGWLLSHPIHSGKCLKSRTRGLLTTLMRSVHCFSFSLMLGRLVALPADDHVGHLLNASVA